MHFCSVCSKYMHFINIIMSYVHILPTKFILHNKKVCAFHHHLTKHSHRHFNVGNLRFYYIPPFFQKKNLSSSSTFKHFYCILFYVSAQHKIPSQAGGSYTRMALWIVNLCLTNSLTKWNENVILDWRHVSQQLKYTILCKIQLYCSSIHFYVSVINQTTNE